MPRRRSSSARRSFDALFDTEPKTPNGTPAYGTPAHSAWLAQAYGWGPQNDLKRLRAKPDDDIVVTRNPETGKPDITNRNPSATLAAEPEWVETRRRHEAKRIAYIQRVLRKRKRDENRLVFDPSQVFVGGYKGENRDIPRIKYLGPGYFNYEIWCAYAGVTPKTGPFKYAPIGLTADELHGTTAAPAGPDTPEARQAARENFERETGIRFGVRYYNPEYPQFATPGSLPFPTARLAEGQPNDNTDPATTDDHTPTSPPTTRRITRSMSRQPSTSPRSAGPSPRSAGPSPRSAALGSDESRPPTPGVTSRQPSSAGLTRRSSAATANRRTSSGTRRSPRSRRNSQVFFALLG